MTSKKIEVNNNKLLYKQVKDYILQNIKDKVFKLGELIPPERDLCKDLGVSRYTIRKAIKELVKEGYLFRVQGNGTFVFDKKQNIQSRNKFIGVVLPSCDTEMEMKILSGIQQGLNIEEYNITFMNSDNNYRKETENIQILKNRGAAGLIIMPAEDQKDSTGISDLKAEGFPFVLVDRRLQDCETDCIMSDNIAGGCMATEYLIRFGHKKIAFIKHKSNKTSSVEDRILGYKKILSEYGFDFNYVFSFDKDRNELDFYKFLQEKQPTALIVVNDYIALDVIRMCKQHHIKIPNDISIISFDDLSIVKYLEVPLTTIAQHSKEIGRKAAQLLMEKMDNGGDNAYHYVQIYYPTKLIERDSCLKIN